MDLLVESAVAEALAPPRRRNRIGSLIALLRPRHWLKGSLVILGPLVTAPLALISHAVPIGLTLLAFLAAASMIYVLNDLRDRDADRLHPVKRLRPLACGLVTTRAALAMMVLAGIAMAVALVNAPPQAALIVGAYVAMNVWYSLSLKHQPLVDVSVVASGFVLRVLAGLIATGLPVQPFLLICVYCACVGLSLGKRRHELSAHPDGARHRSALAAYSVPLLDSLVLVNLVLALVGYVAFAWTLRHGAILAVITFPFAAFTVFRYLQMVMVERSGGDPVDDLVGDTPMRVNLGLWTAILVPALIVSAL